MNKIVKLTSLVRHEIFSLRLKRNFSAITDTALVQLRTPSGDVVLSTGSAASPRHTVQEEAIVSVGALTNCCEVDFNEITDLQLTAALVEYFCECETEVGSWHIFKCTFNTGITDHIALFLKEASEVKKAIGLISSTWPILREDCLRDLVQSGTDACDRAMLWMVASKIDVAILIMNARGLLLRANAAAKAMLDSEQVLHRTCSGIKCVNGAQTKGFVDAIAACASASSSDVETIIFLDSKTASLRVPVTLSRFQHDGAATDLVAVMMPTPPDSRRVEMLARAVGLTPAEARVATLLQMGLSNKDAARVAGLKEQSVSTYAKRVLNKLNVTSRAEMAQMLTWQAAGGRL